MAVASIVAGIAQGVAQAGYGIYQDQRDYREKQRQFNEQMDWNKHVQEVSWKREDNAMQRAKADATAAGYSPLAAIGQQETGTTVSAPGATAGNGNQVNFAGLAETIAQAEQHAHEKEMQEKQIESQEKMQEKQLESTNLNAKEQRELQKQQTADTIASAEKIAQMSNNTQLTISNNAIAEQLRHNTAQEAAEAGRLYLEWYKEHHIPGTGEPKKYTDYKEYKEALYDWEQQYQSYLKTLPEDETTTVEQELSDGLEASLGAGAKGTSAKTGGKKGYSEHGQKTTRTESKTARMLEAYQRSHPMPIFIGGH